MAASTAECLLEVGTCHQDTCASVHRWIVQCNTHRTSSRVLQTTHRGDEKAHEAPKLRSGVRKLPRLSAERSHCPGSRWSDHVRGRVPVHEGQNQVRHHRNPEQERRLEVVRAHHRVTGEIER